MNRLLEDPRVARSECKGEALIKAANAGHFDVVNRLLDDPRVDPTLFIDSSTDQSRFIPRSNVRERG